MHIYFIATFAAILSQAAAVPAATASASSRHLNTREDDMVQVNWQCSKRHADVL